ncbi:MAG: 1-deoxy-D-xylulose 5-phosphate synthase [uncultured Nocardioidaceae bacterium]|uniref:1-deoxy-D-xylulose-5-phosphate synthase n=1 Tax=uncultured Nocardioidaceae bacterium TaxID=253824 RepID=A0A6J4MDH4_9ACTN|nr:MAG: 1-deoxy-D-xylulose 5-phosphate synthase [uncultured Nocardioidaceae bacterium]
MGLLESIEGPGDLRGLTDAELDALATEIRARILTAVAANSGHLGPNLGVVELTLALHRVFDSPRDRVLFDTGHQSYVHKMVTGRAAGFDRLRQRGGLSGYPSQDESEHDTIENSHASTSLSYADGLAKAYALRGEDRHVVAVIGDGALTGGMAWEALNNIAAGQNPLVVVVNDNGRSYTPTVGGLADRLTALRTSPRYEPTLDVVKETLNRVPAVGAVAYDALHAVKKGLKDALAPQGLFEDLGLKYLGPIDGHDRGAVEHALAQAKRFGGPVIVHVITTKGQGYDIAVRNEVDQMHQTVPFDPDTGDAITVAPAGWTSVFRDQLVRLGEQRSDLVAITAAMTYPTGLDAFATRFPERTFDVGIAEQHAVTSAAGLALGGLHPVVAVYATFLNRAFDQVLLDVALHRCGVTFVLDRAGVTGDDGPSHNGMWDMSILQVVPGLRLAAPRDGAQLRELLNEAVEVGNAPTVVRFPKGAVPDDVAALERIGCVDVLTRGAASDVLLVAVGSMVVPAIDVAAKLEAQGIGVTLVDPRWVLPVDDGLVRLAAEHGLLVSMEDNGRAGGVGSALLLALEAARVDVPVRVHAVPQAFPEHAKRNVLLEDMGLTAEAVTADTIEQWARLPRTAGPGTGMAAPSPVFPMSR